MVELNYDGNEAYANRILKKGKEEAIKVAIKATKKWEEENKEDFEKKRRDEELTPKAKELISFLTKTNFGCYQKSVALLCEHITGEKIEKYITGKDKKAPLLAYPVPFAVVVPTNKSTNGHNYPLEKPTWMAFPSYPYVGVLETGLAGNMLDTDRKKLRAATNKEITSFFDLLFKQ